MWSVKARLFRRKKKTSTNAKAKQNKRKTFASFSRLLHVTCMWRWNYKVSASWRRFQWSFENNLIALRCHCSFRHSANSSAGTVFQIWSRKLLLFNEALVSFDVFIISAFGYLCFCFLPRRYCFLHSTQSQRAWIRHSSRHRWFSTWNRHWCAIT